MFDFDKTILDSSTCTQAALSPKKMILMYPHGLLNCSWLHMFHPGEPEFLCFLSNVFWTVIENMPSWCLQGKERGVAKRRERRRWKGLIGQQAVLLSATLSDVISSFSCRLSAVLPPGEGTERDLIQPSAPLPDRGSYHRREPETGDYSVISFHVCVSFFLQLMVPSAL